ncbi:MAG: cytochrome b/b6 domain-containing protein [Bacillota bacterium]
MNDDNNRVTRFNIMERLGHWSHAVPFTVLLLTGLTLVFGKYNSLFGGDTLRFFSKTHHFMGYVFSFLAVAVLIIGTPKTFIAWIKACFSWSRDDFKFVLGFPKEFFGLKADLPKQGKFNAGEKINSILTMVFFVLMVVTGWIMLNPEYFSKKTLFVTYSLHAAGAMFGGAVFLGHVYLSLVHPGSRESIKGMIFGTVSKQFAKEHHALWYEELQAKGELAAGENDTNIKKQKLPKNC